MPWWESNNAEDKENMSPELPLENNVVCTAGIMTKIQNFSLGKWI